MAYSNTGYMYEKYNAYEVGVGGGGGEYKPQIGFGWSNGVALVLLRDAYLNIDSNGGSGNGDFWSSEAGYAVAMLIGFIFMIGVSLIVGVWYLNGLSKSQPLSKDRKEEIDMSPI